MESTWLFAYSTEEMLHQRFDVAAFYFYYHLIVKV